MCCGCSWQRVRSRQRYNNRRQYRTKSVWQLCTPSACKFPVIFHKNAREYIKYSLRFSLSRQRTSLGIWQASHLFSRAKSAPRLTCGANMEYHYPSIPRVMAKQSAGLLVRQKWIARCKRNTANGQRAAAGHPPQVMALSPVSLGGAGMYLLCWIFDCQGA